MESRGRGVVKVKDTEQDGVGWRRPALSVPLFLKIFFQAYLFILREREQEPVCEPGEGQRKGGRERENPKQFPHCQCRA